MDGLLSWSVGAGEAGESAKCPWVEAVELIASKWRGGKKFTCCALHHPTHRYFVLSPASLTSRDQDGSSTNSTIDSYNLTDK